MALIDPKKLTLPVTVAISLLSFAAGAGVTYGKFQAKLHDAGEVARQAKADVAEVRVELSEVRVTMAGEHGDVQARLKNIEASLTRLEHWAGTK